MTDIEGFTFVATFIGFVTIIALDFSGFNLVSYVYFHELVRIFLRYVAIIFGSLIILAISFYEVWKKYIKERRYTIKLLFQTFLIYFVLYLWPWMLIPFQEKPPFYYLGFFSLWFVAGIVLGRIMTIIGYPLEALFQTVGKFYREKKKEQIRVVGLLGLFILFIGFFLQLISALIPSGA